MYIQNGFPMSQMSNMQGVPYPNPTMPYGFMPFQPMNMTSPTTSMPIPEEIQVQQLQFQLQQLKLMKQNIEQSLEFVTKSSTEVENAIKNLQTTKSKKGA